jgi:hypothetical protein
MNPVSWSPGLLGTRPLRTAFLVLAALLPLAGAPPEEPVPAADPFRADPSWKPLGPSLWFDPPRRRLILRARVVLRDGFLEHLLCLSRTKEHEAILATDAPPRLIHAGLLLTGATTGHPVRFQPRFEPPTGSAITIVLEWTEADRPRRANAREWITDEARGTTLARDWVFAGSDLFRDPDSGRMIYSADGGDLITVANFPSAILDLPFASSADDQARSFVANTPRIPPLGTSVTMILRPASRPGRP